MAYFQNDKNKKFNPVDPSQQDYKPHLTSDSWWSQNDNPISAPGPSGPGSNVASGTNPSPALATASWRRHNDVAMSNTTPSGATPNRASRGNSGNTPREEYANSKGVLRWQLKGVDRGKLRRGMVIWAEWNQTTPHYRTADDYTLSMNPNTPNEYVKTMYGVVRSKARKYVIISLHADHFIALPIFTRDGKGLLPPPPRSGNDSVDYYVSIRDYEDRNNPVNAQGESVHGIIYVHDNPHRNSGDMGRMHPKAYMALHVPISIPNNAAMIVLGRLKQPDFTKVLRLKRWCCTAENGLENLPDLNEPPQPLEDIDLIPAIYDQRRRA